MLPRPWPPRPPCCRAGLPGAGQRVLLLHAAHQRLPAQRRGTGASGGDAAVRRRCRRRWLAAQLGANAPAALSLLPARTNRPHSPCVMPSSPQWTIHPWCHNSCNQLSTDDQLRGVQVPDVHPAALVPGAAPVPPLHSPQAPTGLRSVRFGSCSSAAGPCPVPCPHPPAGPGLLSMSAGDFGEVYRQPEYAAAFDAVAACFFLDTA